jgi:hypothetical protein
MLPVSLVIKSGETTAAYKCTAHNAYIHIRAQIETLMSERDSARNCMQERERMVERERGERERERRDAERERKDIEFRQGETERRRADAEARCRDLERYSNVALCSML